MKQIVLTADATCGVDAKVGDHIPAGRRIGVQTETGKPLIAPQSGAVSEIIFDPDRHEFRIVIDVV